MEEVLERPVERNSILGEFTHCGNVLDLCAVAVPAGVYSVSEARGGDDENAENGEGGGELPFSVTFLGGSNMDAEVLEIADRFDRFHRGGED